MVCWACLPWLIESEWLHYGYALVMLAGFWLLRDGFVGRARLWWGIALGVQVWHHLEHLLLLVQSLTGQYLLGRRCRPVSPRSCSRGSRCTCSTTPWSSRRW
ncbi:hypothetical protein [Micromonospora sp. b486]|uniref:hypothetical protein n=1 Tax=Micromonospora sp. b486 TaxID=3053986 RepID=UPI00259CCBEE|nr:hypothetical protein [Micromonospora sp. b486]MDM4777988.1 hypothetical protein [Micromonospora sp. b486]